MARAPLTRPLVATLCLIALATGAAGDVYAADLRPDTTAAFDRYVRLTESRIDTEVGGQVPFLWIDRLPEGRRRDVEARLHRGEVVVPFRRRGHEEGGRGRRAPAADA